jgi:flagellar operon protein
VTRPVDNPALLPPGVGGPPAVGRRAPVQGVDPPAGRDSTLGPAFADVLAGRAAEVRFSGHALDRVRRRGIDLDPDVLRRLGAGVDRAAAKGSRDAVVLVDGTAFVVGVRSRTVVTAVDSAHMREHVFTNIDSAVIA